MNILPEDIKIVFLGAGNVATHLALKLFKKKFNIVQVYSRTIENARILSGTIDAIATQDVCEIITDADLYIVSLSDDAVVGIIDDLHVDKGLVVHTSGTLDIDVLRKFQRRGVFYPLQTFSKKRNVDFEPIPIMIEAFIKEDETFLLYLGHEFSMNVSKVNSEQRRYIHLAAVFTCNFTNFMYVAAQKILSEKGLDFNILLPLIKETTEKLHGLSPYEAQTGPALRNNHSIMDIHKNILKEHIELHNLYSVISQAIINEFKQNGN